jgi:hypothetical protein
MSNGDDGALRAHSLVHLELYTCSVTKTLRLQ